MMIAYKFPNLMIDAHYNRSITEDLALFVFIPNKSNLEQSIIEFAKLRSDERQINDEVWLVDVSAQLNPEDAAKAFAEAPLDLDDELYF